MDNDYFVVRKNPELIPIEVIEGIKAEISDMYPNYTDEKGYRMIRKSDVLNILDRHIKEYME